MTETIRFGSDSPAALAIIIASNEPLLFLTAGLVVIAASSSFCRAFEIDPAKIVGRKISGIGNGEWASPKLASLLNATASGSARIEAYEIDLERPGQETRRLILNAQILADTALNDVNLLLAVTDVTLARSEARQKDQLIREKAMLIQEVQHRIANSLQIIASVLMQSARRVQSEEARGYLVHAHQRVMSIAAVQRQLAATEGDKVILRDYLMQLGASLGASMIVDPERLSLSVTADNTVVSASDSVSLGLIVTELVINAFKHGFPDQASGVIRIDYRADGSDWTLTVIDDGVGIAEGEDAPKSGLGTGIVQALSRNLQSVVTVTDAKPGTAVTITHRAADGQHRNAPPAA